MALALALSVLALGAVGQFGVVVENLAGTDLEEHVGAIWGALCFSM